jgi:DNA mismatch repair protein MutS
VFPGSGDVSSLFQRIDRTRTPGGRTELRRRITELHVDADAIHSVQDALRFLIVNMESARALVGSPAVPGVDRYLQSRYAIADLGKGVTAPARGFWLSLRHPELVDHARGGISIVGQLLDAIRSFPEHQPEGEAPTSLLELVRPLRAAASVVQAALPADSKTMNATLALRADQELRTTLRDALLECLKRIHALDALTSMALATRELGWTIPTVEVDEEGPMVIEGLTHPLLDHAIPNDLAIEAGAPLLFLTGPNMAGKTTFMRALGLAVILAQMGMGVPARRMRWVPFQYLMTGITPVDSVRQGSSFFLSEVRRLRKAGEVLASGARAMLLFDEIFRGTNFHDALEASHRVVAAFARQRESVTVISSHASDLVPRLLEMPQVVLRHFDMDVRDGHPSYPYELRPGAFTGRLAMVLVREEGLAAVLEALEASPALSQ